MISCPKPNRPRKPAYDTLPGGREVCHKSSPGRAEYMARKMQMAVRQQWLCGLCGLYMMREDVTFDHEHGRGMGGSKRDDRCIIDGKWHNAAVHMLCNTLKGSRHVPYVVTE